LAYVLVSTRVIVAFWLAALVIGWFIGAAVARRPAARITLRQGIRVVHDTG